MKPLYIFSDVHCEKTINLTNGLIIFPDFSIYLEVTGGIRPGFANTFLLTSHNNRFSFTNGKRNQELSCALPN